MYAATVEVGPNLVAVILALIAFATTVVNTILANKQRKEMKPNGGSSLRDAVDRIEQHTAVTAATVAPQAVIVPVPVTPTPTSPPVKSE